MSCRAFALFSVLATLASGQLVRDKFRFDALRYATMRTPNGGLIEVRLIADSQGIPGQTGWYKLCNSTSQASKSIALNAACRQYGYTDGLLYQNTHGRCAEFACNNADYTTLHSCDVYVRPDNQPVLSVLCYYEYGYPLAQKLPFQDQLLRSVNCDFENLTTCGWQLSSMNVVRGDLIYIADATFGTDRGHFLRSDCGLAPVPPSRKPEAVSIQVETDDNYCFNFYSYNPTTSSGSSSVLVSVIGNTGAIIYSAKLQVPHQGDWTFVQTALSLRRGSRIQLQLECGPNPPPLLDELRLVRGSCPFGETRCYGDGTRNERDDVRECNCRRWLGRWCELSPSAASIPVSFSSLLYVLLVSCLRVTFFR